MRKITFYKSTSGKQPVQQFLDQLDEKQVSKVLWVWIHYVCPRRNWKKNFPVATN